MELITSDQRRQYNRFTADGARKALVAVNPEKDGLQRLFARGDEWQAYLEAGVKRFTAKVPNYDFAKSILGSDLILPEEIATARGLTYTDEQLMRFYNTLPAQEIFEWCYHNSMMLIAGPPTAMSLLDICAIKTSYFYSMYSWKGGWYAKSDQKFSRNDKVETGWVALRKKPVAVSLGKKWSEQGDLVAEPMVVPNVAEVVWGITAYKAVRGKYLSRNFYMRTSSCDSCGLHVKVEVIEGILIHGGNDDDCDPTLGVVGARKF